MKTISDLINELTAIREQHGDIPVMIDDEHGDYYFSVAVLDFFGTKYAILRA